MTLKAVDNKAIYVLAHVLASTMPDVLDLQRREQWLQFAIDARLSLCLELGFEGYILSASSSTKICLISPEADETAIQKTRFGMNSYTPHLAGVLGDKAILIEFAEGGLFVEYHDHTDFQVDYDDVPYALIYLIQGPLKAQLFGNE
jgi:hypothetical protein